MHVLSAGAGKMTVAVDYAPEAGMASPRIADIRFRASRPFTMTKATTGEALAAAGKELYIDPKTGQPWRARADGALQMVIQSVASANDIHAGRIATLELTYDGNDPVSLWLVRRDEVFAPPTADNALQSTPYDSPVTVIR
jgi:hypothetical protein